MQRNLDWVAAQGIWAPVLFVFVYAGATVAFIPGSLLTLSAGAVFGVVKGAALVSLGSIAQVVTGATTTAQKVLYGVGLLATLVVVVWITQIAINAIEWILFCDADGCTDLQGLAPFFTAAAEGNDLILGNRNLLPESRASLTWPQRFGNALAGWLIWLRWGKSFGDLGPLRLIRRTRLESLHMEDRGFGWTVEMQAKAAALKLKTREIPVSYFPRRGGKSKISGTVSGTIKAGLVILGTLAKLWLRKTPHV
jgi:hypothetical protein